MKTAIHATLCSAIIHLRLPRARPPLRGLPAMMDLLGAPGGVGALTLVQISNGSTESASSTPSDRDAKPPPFAAADLVGERGPPPPKSEPVLEVIALDRSLRFLCIRCTQSTKTLASRPSTAGERLPAMLDTCRPSPRTDSQPSS